MLSGECVCSHIAQSALFDSTLFLFSQCLNINHVFSWACREAHGKREQHFTRNHVDLTDQFKPVLFVLTHRGRVLFQSHGHQNLMVPVAGRDFWLVTRPHRPPVASPVLQYTAATPVYTWALQYTTAVLQHQYTSTGWQYTRTLAQNVIPTTLVHHYTCTPKWYTCVPVCQYTKQNYTRTPPQ